MGMFSGAMAAGGGAVADQAKGLIDSEIKVNAEKELLAAREQMQMRLNEAQEQTRRSGRQADFDTDLKNAPAKAASDVASLRTTEGAKTELGLARKDAEFDQGMNQARVGARYRKANPEIGEAEREAAANKEAPGSAKLREAQARYYDRDAAAGARARAPGAKGDDEKTAQNLANGYLKTAKALEDSGDMESARALREKAQATLDGIGQRQEGKGKGAAEKSYPPVAQSHATLLNQRLREKPKDAKLIISAFERTYGPGSADALIE